MLANPPETEGSASEDNPPSSSATLFPYAFIPATTASFYLFSSSFYIPSLAGAPWFWAIMAFDWYAIGPPGKAFESTGIPLGIVTFHVS